MCFDWYRKGDKARGAVACAASKTSYRSARLNGSYYRPVRRVITLRGRSVAVSEESRFVSEQELEDAVKAHPEVLPSQDLGLGALFAMGSQLDFGAGPLDLLCADAQGQLAIVEFKRGSENPDVRKVVAQMLDYGSALWRASYEDLAQRCERGRSVPLETHVSERCTVLGEPFDPESFQTGVTRCLDAGDFAFLYVAGDVDLRTRRVMTYMAEGPRMRFLGVEVELYRHPGGDDAVLVPRTAFVPSWVTGPGSASGGGRPGAALSLADAAPAVRELLDRMDTLVDDLDLEVRQTRGGLVYHPAVRHDGSSSARVGVAVYLRRQSAELNLQTFRESGADELAEGLRERLQRLIGSPPALKYPVVSCADLLRDWDATRDQLMEPYFSALAGLASTKRQPDRHQANE